MLNPRWLKIKEAVRYSAIGKDRLKQLAADGIIIGFNDPDSGRGDWIFDRHSLDHYREDQAGNLMRKALAIMNRP